jgi:hypothetical protein
MPYRLPDRGEVRKVAISSRVQPGNMENSIAARQVLCAWRAVLRRDTVQYSEVAASHIEQRHRPPKFSQTSEVWAGAQDERG